ncbi:MAG: type II secretion system protein, partial [Planctomycetota bacterium]
MSRMTHEQSTSRAAARGFTLTEALVAVFAIALLSSGLAAIFASVGDTVERGRRVSAINQYAAVIERQLRADIAAMTREGFLVIRNEYAGGFPPPLSATQIPLSRVVADEGRARRIDELMFFARGSFESVRSPIASGLNIRATAARIYYGHGQKQLEGAEGFFEPIFDDPNADPELRLGFDAGAIGVGEANPNLYASEWTLLRHATLLVKPERSFASQINSAGAGASRVYDNELQLDFEPAADSIFRSLAFWGNPRPGVFEVGDDYDEWSLRGATAPPTFPSGVVDIATETLSEIRRRVTAVDLVETQITRGDTIARAVLDTPSALFEDTRRLPYYVPTGGNDTLFRLSPEAFLETRRALVAGQVAPNPLLGDAEGLQSLVHQQHAWMWDALPAASNEFTWDSNRDPAREPDLLLVPRLGQGGGETNPTRPGFGFPSRMRYENTPPGYIAATFGADAAATDTGDLLERAAFAGARA